MSGRFGTFPVACPAGFVYRIQRLRACSITVQVLMHPLLYCRCIYSPVEGRSNSIYVMATDTISTSSTFAYTMREVKSCNQITSQCCAMTVQTMTIIEVLDLTVIIELCAIACISRYLPATIQNLGRHRI